MKVEKLCHVYRHTSPSGKVYVGITTQKPENRGDKGSGYKSSPYMKCAIKKYGGDSFIHEVLFSGLSQEDAKSIEIGLIKQYKELGISYNMSNGGEGRFGFPSGNKGLKCSDKHRENISKANKTPFNNGNSKKVIQMDMDCNELNEFPSMHEAQRVFVIQQQNICKCCKGKLKYTGGFKGKYKEE